MSADSRRKHLKIKVFAFREDTIASVLKLMKKLHGG